MTLDALVSFSNKLESVVAWMDGGPRTDSIITMQRLQMEAQVDNALRLRPEIE